MSQSMLASELIELLERRGLLDQEIVDALKQQLAESGARVTPEAVAKLLVDNGHLTRFQATKLIGELRSEQYINDESESPQPQEAEEYAQEPELTLGDEEVVAVEAVDSEEVVAVEVVEVEAMEVEAVEVEAVEVEAIEVMAVEVEAEAVPVEAVEVGNGRPKRPRQKRATPEPEKSIWDSFKIYGVAISILALLPLGWFFYNYINKGNAAEYMERANGFYTQQNYTSASQTYSDFLDNFGDDTDDSSLARVRIVMSNLFQTKQNASDPEKSLNAAKELLPTITDEPALEENRADLAGLLIDVAEDFTSLADRTETANVKEAIIEKLDEQLKLIAEPTYVSSQVRDSMAKRLSIISEDRMRVIRDISRDRKLDDALAKMKTAISNKDTKTAYDIRKDIILEYPRLHDEQRMLDLIIEASQIQQELVKPGGTKLEVVLDDIESQVKTAINLTNRSGKTLNELGNLVYYVRAGGSVAALSAADGSLLWRRFVGYRDEHAPLPLGETPEDGVLLSDGSRLEVQRLSGTNGKIEWRVAVGETFTSPVLANETLNFSLNSGKLVSINAASGETRWVSQLPQELEVSPGVDSKHSVVYAPGNHSNLYVLSHRDGKCGESFYIGHTENSIRTPPISLMGHVFVFENKASDYAVMHVLKTDDQGKNLEKAQNSFRLKGNVVVAPEVYGRRLIVVTNLGQVQVFDIEPTADANKVTLLAEQVPSYEEPTMTQMAIDRSQMWVVGSEITRYELQINTGRVLRGWVKHDGDLFTAKPQVIDNVLINARVVRGSKGIRVTAREPKSGEVFWQTDLGVPTALVAFGDGKLHSVTSQAALYEINAASITAGATTGSIENPGLSGHGMEFVDPVDDASGTKILVNQTKPRQIAVYNPSRERQKLRLVTLALPEGTPNSKPVISGGGLLVPMDSGRIALMDWKSGRSLATPFQPSKKPGEVIDWTDPVTLPGDKDQVVIGDSRRKLYRIRVGEQIRQLSDAKLERDLLGPMTAVDQSVLALASGPSADMLLSIDATSLALKNEQLLEGRAIWGPKNAGGIALVATDDSNLVAFDPDGAEQWKAKIPTGRPVGYPVIKDGAILLSGKHGWVIRVNPVTGEILGTTTIGQPLSGSPLPFNKVFLVPGSEGIVFAIDSPSK